MINLYQAKLLLLEIGSRLGFIGCRFVGTHQSGNSILKLNRKSMLGIKGDLVIMPKDQVMYRNLKHFGKWELDESVFLASAMKNAKNSSNQVTLIDVGANCGLTAMQALNLLRVISIPNDYNYILIEPHPLHVIALNENLKKYFEYKVKVCPYALAIDNAKEVEIYTESKNYGNSSLIRNVVNESNRTVNYVQTKSVGEFLQEELQNKSLIVLKIDIQGLDSLILNEFTSRIPEAIQAVVVEVWAISSISKLSVEKLRNYISTFEYRSWRPFSSEKVPFDEILDFWTSKTEKTRNLFLSKSLVTRI